MLCGVVVFGQWSYRPMFFEDYIALGSRYTGPLARNQGRKLHRKAAVQVVECCGSMDLTSEAP